MQVDWEGRDLGGGKGVRVASMHYIHMGNCHRANVIDRKRNMLKLNPLLIVICVPSPKPSYLESCISRTYCGLHTDTHLPLWGKFGFHVPGER